MTTLIDHQKTGQTLGLEVVRVMSAPPARVFAAFTTGEAMARWLGPRSFTCPVSEVDFRVGGGFHACIRSPEGKDYWMRATYTDIVPDARIAFDFHWEKGCETLDCSALVTKVVVNFEPASNGMTRLRFRQTGFETPADSDSHEEGWGECIDRLAAYVVYGA